ncbi:hypothetical protein BGZ94_005547 [Podila epigama]|nr:hypothetical protein BGZ94_005547 [Podila epigama]
MDYDTIEALVEAPFQKSILLLKADTATIVVLVHLVRMIDTTQSLVVTLVKEKVGPAGATATLDPALHGTENIEIEIIETMVTITEITEITEIIGTIETAEVTIDEAILVNVIHTAATAVAAAPDIESMFNRRRRSPSPPADESTCDRRTVFVMQLSARARSSDLDTFFSQAGKVRAARIIEDRNTGRSKGVGYVEFYDEESVAKAIALTGQKILGIPVIAKHTESEKNRLALQAANASQEAAATKPAAPAVNADMAQHRLYIGSVNFDLTEDDLKQVLEPFGPIEFVKLHRDPETGKSKGFAFVQYQKAEDAKQALSRLNGYELAGRTIKVGLVTEKGSQNQNNGFHSQYNGAIDNSISIDDSDTAGYTLTNLSRADLMQKLARGDVSLGAIPTPPSSASGAAASTPGVVPARQLPVVMPSRSVLLKNMFTEEDKNEPEWAKELEEDVKEEAEKCGTVVHIHVEQESVGEIYLKFDSVQSATKAVQSLGGRFFAGRQIVAAYLPEMLYNVRFPRAANLEITSDLEREILIYRDAMMTTRGSPHEVDSSSRPMGQRQGSGHSSPTQTMTEAGAFSPQAFKDTRTGDHQVTVSPTYSLHHPPQSNTGLFMGREDPQSIAADHVVLYTILHELCNLRMIMIGVYRLLSLSVSEIEMEVLLPEVEHGLQMYDSQCQEICSTVLGSGILHELRILRHGLLLDRAIAEYDVQISSTHLYLAKTSLSEWKQQSLEQDYTDNKSNVKGKSNLQPNHCLWLNRWIASEKSKLTMYFMDILLEKEQAMGGDERSLWADVEPDMHGLIRTFRKKSGARSISFVYEISPDVRFSTTGFISANAPYEAATGLNSFPCIYSYPPDPPKDHWPNIISIMQGSVAILKQFRSQYFYDRKIGCTYYVARIDRHVSIVIIYLDKHPSPDNTAMEFLQLLAGKLRHTDVLTSLRTE